jgi:Spy/CpxP family protein refolding chaperone
MIVNRHSLRRAGAAAAIACLVGSAAVAGSGDAQKDARACGPGWPAPPRPLGPGFGDGPPLFGPGGEDRPPPYLRELHLNEDQDDKVFGILHAAAPEMRERGKAARKAREALHELGQSAQYDASKAAALAQALGAAEGQLALIRARADREIFLLLTPEQRERLAEGAHDGPERGREGAPPPR